MRQLTVGTALLAMALGSGALLAAGAQEPGQDSGAAGQRGQYAGMQRVAGEVTAVGGDTFSVKTEDGSTMKVATTSNTRVMMGRGEAIKVADVKVGDGVMAFGNLDAPNKTLHAAMVGVSDAEQMRKLKENLGKTYIAGKVTAINLDDAKMTVLRADGVSQTIAFDETTSFKRGGRGVRAAGGAFGDFGPGGGSGGTRGGGGNGAAGAGAQPAGGAGSGGESITLADIKVGDAVGGPGSLKAGVFVPTQLTVAVPRPPRREGAPGAGPATGGAGPAASAPKPM